MQKLVTQLNLRELTIAYGMSKSFAASSVLRRTTLMCSWRAAETSPVSFQTTTSDPLDKRVDTVGKVQPHVKAKVVDLEGKVLPVNTPGELHTAGYLLQKG